MLGETRTFAPGMQYNYSSSQILLFSYYFFFFQTSRVHSWKLILECNCENLARDKISYDSFIKTCCIQQTILTLCHVNLIINFKNVNVVTHNFSHTHSRIHAINMVFTITITGKDFGRRKNRLLGLFDQ